MDTDGVIPDDAADRLALLRSAAAAGSEAATLAVDIVANDDATALDALLALAEGTTDGAARREVSLVTALVQQQQGDARGAFKHLARSAAAGSRSATGLLGRAFLTGNGTAVNIHFATDLLLQVHHVHRLCRPRHAVD